MRVALVTTYDPGDPNTRSGWAHHMLRALRANDVDVTPVGPLREHGRLTGRARARVEARLAGRTFDPYRAEANGRALSRQVERLAGATDVVLTTECVPISFLAAGKPVALWADATFARLVDFYPDFTALSGATRRDGETLERRGLHRCDLAMFSSRWAAASARDHYGVDAGRVAVVPWGANLVEVPSRDDVASMQAQRRSGGVLRALFLGGDWVRKGGPVAVSCVRELNRRHVPVELVVVGCRVPPDDEDESVQVVGPVDKYEPAGGRVLWQILAAAHVLLLPSSADCTPLAVAEAAAFGVPAIVSDIGGLPEMVEHGYSGWVLPAGSTATQYADVVAQLHGDRDALDAAGAAARCRFETELNWPVAARRVTTMLERLR